MHVFQAMKHSSNDMKQLSAQIVILLSRTASQQPEETAADTPGLSVTI